MIRHTSEKQGTLVGFKTGLERELDGENRWVRLAGSIPWDELAEGYYKQLSKTAGRPAKGARLVIGAVIIKHKLCLSDEETVRQIQENPYLQYFVGMKEFQKEAPFAPSLFVEIRRRMGEKTFLKFDEVIVKAVEKAQKKGKSGKNNDDIEDKIEKPDKNNDDVEPKIEKSDENKDDVESKSGKLILDATVAAQAIKYPTDIDLLNRSREISEEMIDVLAIGKKPRTYREKARKDYLAVVKRRKASPAVRRRGVRQQLQYIRRNFKHIKQMLDGLPNQEIPLSRQLLRKYWIIQTVFEQQNEMYRAKKKRVGNRIVSISQPHVRPIVRGKRETEFGAKMSVSLTNTGIATVDRIGWEAYHEGGDMKEQVEKYQNLHGQYPEAVIGDPIYGTQENRKWLKEKGIRFSGKPLGRPRKETSENKVELKEAKKQRQADYRERIPIEGKFGQGKNGYQLNYIKAKTAKTSEAWIKSIFFVMNLIVLERIFRRLLKQMAQMRRIVEYKARIFRTASNKPAIYKYAQIRQANF